MYRMRSDVGRARQNGHSSPCDANAPSVSLMGNSKPWPVGEPSYPNDSIVRSFTNSEPEWSLGTDHSCCLTDFSVGNSTPELERIAVPSLTACENAAAQPQRSTNRGTMNRRIRLSDVPRGSPFPAYRSFSSLVGRNAVRILFPSLTPDAVEPRLRVEFWRIV